MLSLSQRRRTLCRMRSSARASKRHLLHRASGSFWLEGSSKSRLRSGGIDSDRSCGSNDVIYDVWPKKLVLLLGRGILLLIVRLD